MGGKDKLMNKIMKKAVAAVTAFALVLGGVMLTSVSNVQAKAKKVSIAKSAKVTVGKTVKVKLKNNKKKVKWKIVTGKKIIKITKKSKTYASVKGIKKGKSKIQAVIGKKKYTCTVTVVAKKKLKPTKKPTATKKPAASPSETVQETKTPTASPSGTAQETKKPVASPSEAAQVTKAPAVSPSGTAQETGKPSTSPSAAVTEETTDVESYSYEVFPLMEPFNSYFYIKTDNPAPDSFRFVDEETKYADEGKMGSVTPANTVFADVKYENIKTKRVKGGYIATGSSTDGGELRLQAGKVTGTHNVYNATTGETTIEKEYEYKDTSVRVHVAGLKDVVDYLISTYGDSSKAYFDNLLGIQSGFSSECLYSGVYVLGEQKKSTTAPYYGLSTSPHVDQIFYIQSPYYRADSKSMLVSALYPMRYDSLGFPSVMMSIAKELDSNATVKWSSSAHYLVDVTYNGETRSYGGAGSGGGQGINANQIKYWYSFDGSDEDAYMKRNLKDVSAMIQEYGAMEVPEEPTDQPKLTWESVRQTVGKEGSYVKLTLLTSIYGGSADGYTFMYDDGSTGEGSQGWGSVGHFTNAWYDGRYFNKWEYYYPGAKFEETVKTESPSIIMKDVSIKLPDDGKTYYYNYNTMDEVSRYNAETGVWSGFMTYYYDSESQAWKADILDYIKYKDGYNYNSIDNQNFIDTCTVTMDEALAMNLDANTDKEPESYYIYNRVTSPGTYHSAGN